MGAALDRLARKLGRSEAVELATETLVKSYKRVVHGKVQDVSKYFREAGAPVKVERVIPDLTRRPQPKGSAQRAASGSNSGIRKEPYPESELGKSLSKSARYLKGAKPGERGGPPIRTGDVVEAAKLLGEGKRVELTSEDKVATLVKELKRLVDEAKAKGDKAPNYDLCNVTVKNTNLFCVENKGISRVKMPQFSGIPVPGSKADKFPKNDKGEVNLSEEFAKFLTTTDVTGDGIPEVIDDKKAKASHLKASQNELVGANVAKIASSMDATGIDPKYAWVWTSKDGYVIDGHHRWAAMVAHGLGKGEDVEVPIHEVDMDIITVLAVATKWAKEMGIKPKKGSV